MVRDARILQELLKPLRDVPAFERCSDAGGEHEILGGFQSPFAVNHRNRPPAPGKAALFGLPHLVSGKGAQGDLRKVNRPAALLRLRLHQVDLCGWLWLRCGLRLFYAINSIYAVMAFLGARLIYAVNAVLPWREPLKRIADPELPGFEVHVSPPERESC